MNLPSDLDWLRPVALQVVKQAPPDLSLEDLIQIGATAAIECSSRFDPSKGAALTTWRWRHAEGAMREHIKVSARRHRLAPMDSIDAWPGDSHPDGAPGPDLCYLMRQCARALSRLPGPQRQLLMLLHGHDLTRADVARELGGDRWTVRAEEKRALAGLRGMMEA